MKLPLILPILIASSLAWSQTPPPLPSGLPGSDAPSLPPGLGSPASKTQDLSAPEPSWIPSGYFELRFGERLQSAPGFPASTLAEARLQLELQEEIANGLLLDATIDLLADDLASGRSFDWETGSGWFDARSLHLSFAPIDPLDLKVGRQVATWGVGDLVFINDLFPKDWNAFFLGRNLEYLKAPQDSFRAFWANDLANLDLVYSPRLEPDRYVDGNRLSFWDPQNQTIRNEATPTLVTLPGDAFSADEWHLRLSRMVGRFELALYGYQGFWKSPAGQDPDTGRALFPALSVFGFSGRGPVGKGILSLEGGSYQSKDDAVGADPFVRNSELRALIGYEQELATELTGSIQYYVERTRDYAAAQSAADRDRDLLTLRLRKQLRQQTLTLNAFAFYSPGQGDSHLRLSFEWQATDNLKWEGGANLFGGADSSFFGQFSRNENAYLSLRRSF